MSTLSKATDRRAAHLRAWLQARFFFWLDKRAARSESHTLTSKNLYIFPTQRGFVFLGLIAVLWLLGTNYQNNLILAMTFLLVSIFIVSILHTYANLAGLQLNYRGASNAHAGEMVEFYFSLDNPRKRWGDGVMLNWQDSELDPTNAQVSPRENLRLSVALASHRRGVLQPKRLRVESFFPLGLLRCWTWLNFPAEALVYPHPLEAPLHSTAVADEEGDGGHPVKGGDDFNALNDYRPGDPLKHVAWKLYAKERGLYTKEFSQNMSREIWLDFSQVAASDAEKKLSALCYWALRFHRQDENYGLLLPDATVPPNKGEAHKARVLEALARCVL